MSSVRFILASASPRRVELLRDAGFDFDIEPADIDESDVPERLRPRELAIYLAQAKARTLAARRKKAIPPVRTAGVVVLGADTVVAVGEQLFGKAETPAEARAMLTRLSGTRQSVITGVAVVRIDDGAEQIGAVESIVQMKAMSADEIDAYVASEQWRGKAGAYGIQDQDPHNDPFVRLDRGPFDNVVGLPVQLATTLLAHFGIHPRGRT